MNRDRVQNFVSAVKMLIRVAAPPLRVGAGAAQAALHGALLHVGWIVMPIVAPYLAPAMRALEWLGLTSLAPVTKVAEIFEQCPQLAWLWFAMHQLALFVNTNFFTMYCVYQLYNRVRYGARIHGRAHMRRGF
jgi:hypothetical protein